MIVLGEGDQLTVDVRGMSVDVEITDVRWHGDTIEITARERHDPPQERDW